MNESKEQQLPAVSDVEKGLLVKNRNFLFSNLARRMSSAQNILFSLALLHAKVEDDYAEAIFYQEDVERYQKGAKYREGRKSRILEDLAEVGTNAILMYDEQILTNPKSGNVKGVLMFADFGYSQGKYHFIFNSTKTPWGDQRISPIIEILKREEINPIVYNLDTFAKLKYSGQVLYEQILLATNNGKRFLKYDIKELKELFGATGPSFDRFNPLKTRYFEPAIDAINKETDLGVTYIVIKRSRTIIGVEIYWSQEKVRIPVTERQISKAHELFSELSLLNADDVELLTRLKEIEQKETKFTAQKLIEDAITYKRQIEREDNEEVQTVQKTIENKREEETKRAEMIEEEKAAKRSELPKFETIPPLDPEAIQKRNNLEKQLMSYFKRISDVNKMNILDLVCMYEDAEEMLQFARQIYKENNGQSMGYIIKILRNWQKNNVQNLTDAKQFQKTNFGTKDKSSNKKDSKKKGNDPSWSNPDYVNETTDETKAELEAEKQRLLARLDNSNEK
jgi:DnaD/phage-associated family protein